MNLDWKKNRNNFVARGHGEHAYFVGFRDDLSEGKWLADRNGVILGGQEFCAGVCRDHCQADYDAIHAAIQAAVKPAEEDAERLAVALKKCQVIADCYGWKNSEGPQAKVRLAINEVLDFHAERVKGRVG